MASYIYKRNCNILSSLKLSWRLAFYSDLACFSRKVKYTKEKRGVPGLGVVGGAALYCKFMQSKIKNANHTNERERKRSVLRGIYYIEVYRNGYIEASLYRG